MKAVNISSGKNWKQMKTYLYLFRMEASNQQSGSRHCSTLQRKILAAPNSSEVIWYYFALSVPFGTCPLRHARDIALTRNRIDSKLDKVNTWTTKLPVASALSRKPQPAAIAWRVCKHPWGGEIGSHDVTFRSHLAPDDYKIKRAKDTPSGSLCLCTSWH